MPPAKKPAARRTTRAASAPSPTAPITRSEVEAAVARFEKALEEAGTALDKIREDLGKSAKGAYKDVASALKTLRRDAQKTSRVLIKDIENLRASVTPAKASTTRATATKAPARVAGKTTAAKTPARSASKATAAKAPTRSAAKAPARSAAKAPARTAAKRTTSRSSRTTSK